MKNRALLLIIVTIGLVWGLVLAPSAYAVNILDPVCENASSNIKNDAAACQPIGEKPIYGPDGILTKVANLFFVIVGIAAVIMIIISGFKYVTASGDSGKVESAKNTLLFAVVGLVVAVSARTIVNYVLTKVIK